MILGQVIGRYVNDSIASRAIRRNKGVFEAESRLWYVPTQHLPRTEKI